MTPQPSPEQHGTTSTTRSKSAGAPAAVDSRPISPQTRAADDPRAAGVPRSTRPRAKGHPGYSETHPRTKETAPVARSLTRTACATWGLSDEVTEAAALVMAELLANAVLHASGPAVRLIVDRPADDRVHLAVVDRAPHRTPELGEPGSGDTSGRGLVLVEALSDRWGYDRLGPHLSPWGKRCWAELRTNP
ncbi:ATP-binding protein [Streptomyces scabiei]|uniref:ATP-binding protein n=1 Tax=Streptomyces scabiei TaxID=1930 RepID=UPI0029A7B7BB|nr:ATP-binding protein [Streptomyces scabiei]MDX2802665.1 ATP-binding protein [Streptomyces scabiei]MDX3277240.1 ATP-binding protein [Streptomyces scabiei]